MAESHFYYDYDNDNDNDKDKDSVFASCPTLRPG